MVLLNCYTDSFFYFVQPIYISQVKRNNRNTPPYNAIHFNSTAYGILLKIMQHAKLNTQTVSQKLNIMTLMKVEYIVRVLYWTELISAK